MDLEKQEQNEHCKVMAEKKQLGGNRRSNYPPCVLVEYEERWDRLKLWIKRLSLATFSGIIYSRLKSLAIKILCCICSSLINEIKSAVKVPRAPGTWYIHANKKVSYSISSATGNTSKTLRTSIIIILRVVKEKLHSEKSCNLIG